MKTKEKLENIKINPKLFWDIKFNRTIFLTNKTFVIERAIQRGEIQDVKSLFEFYGINEIINIIKKSKRIPKRKAIFFSHYFSIPYSQICSLTQLPNPLWKS